MNNSRGFELTVPADEAGTRLDKFLADRLGISRSLAAKLAESGAVSVEGRPAAKKTLVCAGQTLRGQLPEPEPCAAQPEAIPLDVVYEDDWLLVVNKPRGMVVHPAAGNRNGTLVSALLAHCGDSLSGINGVQRPGIVHRLDKDTSGLLIVAKTDEAHKKLAAQIAAHSFERCYEAVLIGHLEPPEGTVSLPIGRSRADRKKMAVTAEHSRPAVTHYRVLCDYPGFSHVRLQLETGRTHQIRVHMAALGHPVAGDPLYGGLRKGIPPGGQILHAKRIVFTHPADGRRMEFESELPEYFQNFLRGLQNDEV